jgi:hypothetical protein
MVVVPAVTPETIPVNEPIAATVGELLLHKPPLVAFVRVVVDPVQMLVVPEMAATAAAITTV